MPKPDAFVTRIEGSRLLEARGFLYAPITLAIYASRGDTPPLYYRRNTRGRPTVGYKWGELLAWAEAREQRIRPNNAAVRTSAA